MRREPEQRFTVDILQNEFIWLETMVSIRSRSCRAERGTVNRVNKPFYVIHCSFVLFVLSYCALLYSYDPDFFLKQWIDSWDDHHHEFRCGGLYAQECTRRTHTVSCGWTNVYDIWCAMSHTLERSGYEQVHRCMHNVLTKIARPLLPCCWGYSLGLFFCILAYFGLPDIYTVCGPLRSGGRSTV